MKIVVYRFINAPHLVMKYWDPEVLDARAYETSRAKALYAALESDPSDEEYTLYHHTSEDRWALFGLICEGHTFAVEVEK